jgi:glycosyltransferase involved in cell wall biosynthesis
MISPRAPLVTVVMPIHGKPLWLAEALQSVVRQSFSDWEFIGFVDGVNPDAADILESFGKRFRYISSPEHVGAAIARQACLLEAQGKYIATLDSDDFWPEDHLEEHISPLELAQDIVLVGCSARKVNSDGAVLPGNILVPDGDIKSKLLRRNVIVNSSAVFRRDAALRSGGYTSESYYAEDYHLWLRLALLGRFVNKPDRFVFYRVHRQQISRRVYGGRTIRAIGHARRRLAENENSNLLKAYIWHHVWAVWQLTLWIRKRWWLTSG